MKQRVTLGRALIHNPDVLILDEPAAGLDPRARVELRELLAVLATQNKAILISSHILTELTEICNGVVIVERGKLLESGTVAEVLKKSTPHRAFVIRVLGDAGALVKELLQTPHVLNAREVSGEVLLDLEGEESAGCELLATLVGKGFKVAEFKQSKANLEDIFMNVTKGGVQ
jgi:ABC-2 type transport system ATP-binding protein